MDPQILFGVAGEMVAPLSNLENTGGEQVWGQLLRSFGEMLTLKFL